MAGMVARMQVDMSGYEPLGEVGRRFNALFGVLGPTGATRQLVIKRVYEWCLDRRKEPEGSHEHVVDGTISVMGLGGPQSVTVRDCVGCGCLVAGGPTRCKPCADAA